VGPFVDPALLPARQDGGGIGTRRNALLYCSIDCETSGLDPARCKLLEIAAVIEDTANPLPLPDLPCWQGVLAHRDIPGDDDALRLNHYLVRRSLAGDDCLAAEEVVPALIAFLAQHGTERWTAAGKNFATFDRRFLETLPGWPTGEQALFRQRVLDPALLFWEPGDTALPDTATCLERAGLPMLATDRALDDARAVVALVRAGMQRLMGGRGLQAQVEGLAPRVAAQRQKSAQSAV